MRIITRIVVAIVVAGAVPAASADPVATIVVTTCDDARVGQKRLAAAERDVEQIYRKAGMAIEWQHDCAANAPGSLRLRILDRAIPSDDRLAEDALGYAVIASHTANVRLDRIYSISEIRGVSPHKILVAVIAHELGHVLLGPGAHTHSGIMQPAFNFGRSSLWPLSFSREQAGKMLRSIATRTRADATN